MLPEQVWDAANMPEKGLFTGKGTGAATPLVWAHAEYIKLLRTKRDCSGCDIIPEVYDRCAGKKTVLNLSAWKKNKPIRRIRPEDTLRVISFESAILHWSKDGWKRAHDDELRPRGSALIIWISPRGPSSRAKSYSPSTIQIRTDGRAAITRYR